MRAILWLTAWALLVATAAGGPASKAAAPNRKSAPRKKPQAEAAAAVSATGTASAVSTAALPAESNALAVVTRKLEESLAELAETRRTIADEKIPLSERLHHAEAAQIEARRQYDAVKRQLDGRSLEATNLRNEHQSREQEKSYLLSLFGEYVRNFEARLHVTEMARYQAAVEEAKLAPENSNLKPAEIFAREIGLVEASMGRLEELSGGVVFAGRASGKDGLVRPGRFVLLGPVAYFASDDGTQAGVAEQRLGSVEPTVEPFQDPALERMTRDLVANGRGVMPFDASLGNARKVEETRESLREHILKGGPIMAPILAVAALALLVVVTKWVSLSLVRTPPARRIRAVLQAVAGNDGVGARNAARRLGGPAGRMLRAGVEHLSDPKDLIEEVMFEVLLDTRFRLQRALPFVSVSAACAPLLGLLGTVTGIITTFKMITVFGSGDIKLLSAGISEALITTEYGLYVAIPSVLAHAFLSRKAKGITDRMERLAIALLGEVEKARARTAAA